MSAPEVGQLVRWYHPRYVELREGIVTGVGNGSTDPGNPLITVQIAGEHLPTHTRLNQLVESAADEGMLF